jgi:pilus assembly protein CpaF
MRPDRLIVGECRGAEVRELLTALNTGHTGGGGTIHANTAEAVPARLVALGALAGLNAEAVRLQVSSALDVVIHVDRTPSGRKVASIGVVTDTRQQQKVVPALSWSPAGMTPGPAWPELASRLSLAPLEMDEQPAQEVDRPEPDDPPRRRSRKTAIPTSTGSRPVGMHNFGDIR